MQVLGTLSDVAFDVGKKKDQQDLVECHLNVSSRNSILAATKGLVLLPACVQTWSLELPSTHAIQPTSLI